MQDEFKKYINIIAKNTRQLRENANFSQEQLAEKIDCSREFLNRVENGKERFSLKSLILLAIVLKVSPKDFFD